MNFDDIFRMLCEVYAKGSFWDEAVSLPIDHFTYKIYFYKDKAISSNEGFSCYIELENKPYSVAFMRFFDHTYDKSWEVFPTDDLKSSLARVAFQIEQIVLYNQSLLFM
jgi:hypothetical protein